MGTSGQCPAWVGQPEALVWKGLPGYALRTPVSRKEGTVSNQALLGQWHLHRGSGDIGGVFSLVFQRLPEGWRIVHDHTTLVKAKAE